MKPDHAPWARLLGIYLVEGEEGAPSRFDYGALRANPADRAALEAYIAALESSTPDELARDDAFAFWVNLYNALTVEVVVSHEAVRSIRDIAISPDPAKGPWGRKLVTITGRALSLDDIEHGILRAGFGDRRVHYALNCASASCPNLAAEPYAGETLDAMLDRAARIYVNSPRSAHVEDGGLRASGIFKWYMKDFGGTEEAVLDEIRRYAEPELGRKLAGLTGVAGYDYDWSLNDARNPGEDE